MLKESLDQLCRELLLLRRGTELAPDEREILDILLRTRPEARRLAGQLERLAALETRAQSVPPPAGLHVSLRARLSAEPAPSALTHGLDALPWIAAALFVALVGYGAWWMWMPALPWSAWSQTVAAAFDNLLSGLSNRVAAVSLDTPLFSWLSLRTVLYATGCSVALLGLLLGIDRDRRVPSYSPTRRERM